MMSAAKVERALTERLERLNGVDESYCVPEYADLADGIRDSPRFPKALRRYKALADENRLLCICLLKRRKELCACELQAATGLTHATVSHHMAILMDAGFVTARRQGKWMYYSLASKVERDVP